MVRKRRTRLPGSEESSPSAESRGSGGQGGPQRPAERVSTQQQRGRGGQGWGPAPQLQGGHGGGDHQGQGGGAQPSGEMPQQQQHALTSEYKGSGGPFPRGGMLQQQHSGGHSGCGTMAAGRVVGPSVGRSKLPAPELHQAMQAPYQAAQSSSSQASSSRQPELSTAQMTTQFQELSVHGEAGPSQATQPVVPPASSKSVRFPPRPHVL